jgi:hypothetical protein
MSFVLQAFDNAKLSNDELVNFQIPYSGVANRHAANRHRTNRQSTDRQSTQGECAYSLRTDQDRMQRARVRRASDASGVTVHRDSNVEGNSIEVRYM